MNLSSRGIFEFVELSFILAILINMISYGAGLYLILKKKKR